MRPTQLQPLTVPGASGLRVWRAIGSGRAAGRAPDPRRDRWDRRDEDQGSVTLFVVVIVVALFAAVGLVVDGGGRVQALRRADAAAAEAARAGGQALQAAPATRGQAARLDTARAAQAARTHLRLSDVDGSVTVLSDTRIRVRTTVTYSPKLLLFMGEMTLTGEADARLARGLTEELP